MKKCFYFPTWEEQTNVMISLNESIIINYSVIPSNSFKESTPTDPILFILCKLTGAKMYGHYIILNTFNGCMKEDIHSDKSENIQLLTGDCFSFYLPRSTQPQHDECDNHIVNNYNNIQHGCDVCKYIQKDYLYGNAFNEYSLFLQNKDNKWEKIKEILNI